MLSAGGRKGGNLIQKQGTCMRDRWLCFVKPSGRRGNAVGDWRSRGRTRALRSFAIVGASRGDHSTDSESNSNTLGEAQTAAREDEQDDRNMATTIGWEQREVTAAAAGTTSSMRPGNLFNSTLLQGAIYMCASKGLQESTKKRFGG